MQFKCFTQNEKLEWLENSKCSPWSATDHSIRAFESEAYNTYTAFQIAYSVYFVTNGSIEFKYRKDTKHSY